MKKQFPSYYDHLISKYKTKIIFYSLFGTLGLVYIEFIFRYNMVIYLIMMVGVLSYLAWSISHFVRFVQFDFASFCDFVGGETVYEQLNIDYQFPYAYVDAGKVGLCYFIRKDIPFRTKYQPIDFFIDYEDISWVYEQTLMSFNHFPFKRRKLLFIGGANFHLLWEVDERQDFDFLVFLKEKEITFISGYSKERKHQFRISQSKNEFIRRVLAAQRVTEGDILFRRDKNGNAPQRVENEHNFQETEDREQTTNMGNGGNV